jgi:hypothetical protein
MRSQSLKPQDLIVALKLAITPEATRQTYAQISPQLGLSASAVHASVRILTRARLIDGNFKDGISVQRGSLLELVIHGVPYFFPATISGASRGMRTGLAQLDADKQFVDSEETYVWPSPTGSVRGTSLLPLHSCALVASENDLTLYKILACIDVLRTEGARERALAREILRQLL